MTTTRASDGDVHVVSETATKDTHKAVILPAGAPAAPSDQTARDGSGPMPPTVASAGTEMAAGTSQGEGEAPAVLRDDSRLTLTVFGVPVPQGSITSLGKGRPAVHSNAHRLKPWRKQVTQAGADVMLAHDRHEGPVRVDLLFCFDRPASHSFTGRNAHQLRDTAPVRPDNRGSGDVDKLARAILDALTDAGVWRDDSQVVDLRARKMWAGDEEALREPGVHITVREVTR